LMLPKLAKMLNICVVSTVRREASMRPVVKLKTAPAPRACLRRKTCPVGGAPK
jgi:hypothetical protein